MRQPDYIAPATLGEAIAALVSGGPVARIIAGGTDLSLLIQTDAVALDCVIDVRAISELQHLDYDAESGLVLGAAVTLRAVETSPVVLAHYPHLARSAAEIGSVQIRNLGTVGGNICTAAPSADLAPALITLGARARVAGPRGERVVPIDEFFTGPRRTDLAPDEVLVDIRIPPPAPRGAGVYLKLANRPAMDTTFVGVAAFVESSDDVYIQTARIALGAVAPTPLRAREAEEILAGQRVSAELLGAASRAAAAACRPISDARGSAEYRREMVAVLTRDAIAAAFEHAVQRP